VSVDRNPAVFLHHILDSAGYIAEYLHGCTKEKFKKERMVRDAVIRELMVIGEACGNLNKEFRNQFSGVAWKKIRGMRNKLTHEYWDINANVVWEAAKMKVPELVVLLKNWLEENHE